MKKVSKSLSKYGQGLPSVLLPKLAKNSGYKRFNLARLSRPSSLNQPIKSANFTTHFNLSITLSGLAMILGLALTGCDKTPPDYRAEVSLPEYSTGDAARGKLLYKEACSQCHQLTPGLNKKGPQLLNIYGAPAADLEDYNYSQSLRDSGWVWDAETLDPYIADPAKVLPESKMLSDPMPDASERTDIIAYLSTLRAPVPTDPNAPISPATE